MCMNRRAFLSSVVTGTICSSGCLTNTVESLTSDHTVDVHSAYAHFTYNDEAYRDVFDYDEERSRDEVVSEPSRSDYSLKVTIPEGEHRGMRMHFWMDEHFDTEPEAAAARFWINVPEEFEFAETENGGGKLPGFQGTYGECGAGDLGPCTGTDGWSARLGFQRPESMYINADFGISYYLYHAQMDREHTYPYGTSFPWQYGISFGEWHQIDQYIQLNTPGESDGILRGWINDTLAFDRDGFRFREEDYDDIQIQEFINTVYFGGEWDSPIDNDLYFDELEIWIDENPFS